MISGNVIVLSPGFQRVWKFQLRTVTLYVLALVLAMAVSFVVAFAYTVYTLSDDPDLHRIVSENQAKSLENRNAEFQIELIRTHVATLEQESSRIASELQQR